MESKLIYSGELSGKLIRADGSHRDMKLSSDTDVILGRPESFWRKMWNRLKFEGIIPATMAFGAFLGMMIGQDPAVVSALVTTTGVNYMAADFISNGVTPTISGLKFHDSGTGAVAAAIGDTALGAAAGPARVSGTGTNPTANVYRSVATIAYTATLAITEWGIFSAATVGTMWDRRVFTAINVVNGDSIQFTYNLTIAAGGS